MKKTARMVVGTFFIELMLFLPIAFVDGLTIGRSTVSAEDVSREEATIRWQTDQLSDSTVAFGKTAAVPQQQQDSRLRKNHSVTLAGLEPNTSYLFKVSSNNLTDTITDDNDGKLFNFTTLRPAKLEISHNIPDVLANGNTLSISGTSLPFAKLQLFVDNNLIENRVANSQGIFGFASVEVADGEHSIKITAATEGQALESGKKIIVDNIPPVLELEDIPPFASEQEFLVNGTVSEESTLKFFVTLAEKDDIPPPHIRQFEIADEEKNAVKLRWERVNKTGETPDFAKYVIFRDDKPVLALTDLFTEETVISGLNSNKTYQFQIAAIDKFGNLGDKGQVLSAKTKEGGRTDIEESPPIIISEGIDGFQKEVKLKGRFTEIVNLNLGETFHEIKVEASDRAGNRDVKKQDILLDNTPPTIDILTPQSEANIFETFANSMVIRGKTEPGAKVYLFVERTPFGSFNRTIFRDQSGIPLPGATNVKAVGDVAGVAPSLEKIADSDLVSGCNFRIDGEEKCRTHADYDTIADADGLFEFEDVDITSKFAGALRVRQLPPSPSLNNDQVADSETENLQTNLFFVARDVAGRTGFNENVFFNINTCFSGKFTWTARPLPKYQSPTFLSIERLRENTEVLYFYFNFSYHGTAKRAFISRIDIDPACGDFPQDDKRFNVSCRILNSCTPKLNPDGTTAYVACTLDKMEGLETIGSDELKSAIDAFKNEIAFPLKITLDFVEETVPFNIPAASGIPVPAISTSRSTQTFCEEVSYVVDAAVIDPRDVLPDWLLFDFVDKLNQTIDILNQAVDKVRELLEWLVISCVVAFVVKFGVQIYRRIACYYDRYFKYISGALGKTDREQTDCQQCVRDEAAARKAAPRYADYDQRTLDSFEKDDVQDKLSDTCLKVCYPSCATAWNAEELMYKTYRFACDRVFGHETPSGWTKTKTDDELYEKANIGIGCTQDQSVKGRPIKPVPCISLEAKYPDLKGRFSRDETCFEIREGGAASFTDTVYKLEKPVNLKEGVYTMVDARGPSAKTEHIIKQNDKNYLYKRPDTCQEICGAKKGSPAKFFPSPTTLKELGDDVKAGEPRGECMLASDCITLQKESRQSKSTGGILSRYEPGKENPIKVGDARLEGYTSNCWDEYAPGSLSGDPDKRVECCCINPEKGTPSEFYQPSDVESDTIDGSKAAAESDMRWSYRYFKTRWPAPSGATEYNPDRYIKGRDSSACFGLNHALYDGLGKTDGKLLVIDPIRQHIAAFQCLAFSQILNRLVLLRNVLNSLRTCLLQIRTTGRADAGVCKELFSQFICSFLWRVISWISNGCLPFGKGIDFTKSDSAIAEALAVGSKSVWESVADTQTELASEYGNAKLNNLLGVGQEAVFRKICLAAFGYDWEIDLDDIIDVAYDAPYATLVQAVLPGREYITFDPLTKFAQYEYRSSWLINPGCSFEGYDVYLACVNEQDRNQFGARVGQPGGINCKVQGDKEGSNCDCIGVRDPSSADRIGAADSPFGFGQGGREILYFSHRGPFLQNQLVEIDSSQITDKIKSSQFRYDHLKFVFRLHEDFYREGAGDPTKCFPEGHENGVFYFPIRDYSARDIVGCTVTIDGTFDCSRAASFFTDTGDARFEELSLVNQLPTTSLLDIKPATYFTESRENIEGTIRYNTDGKQKQCIIARLEDKNGNIIEELEPIDTRLEAGSHTANIRAFRTFVPEDIGGSGATFDIFFDANGIRTLAGNRLPHSILSKTQAIDAAGSIVFNNKDLNNGIDISNDANNPDTVTIDAEEIPLKNICDGKKCDVFIKAAKVSIRFTSVQQTDAKGSYIFTYQSKGVPQISTAGQKESFVLKVDLRHPDKNAQDCSLIRGPAFDNRAIVSGGILQTARIPIFLLPGERGESDTKCIEDSEIKYANKITGQEKIVTNEVNVCACGNSMLFNCPKTVGPDYYKYCFNACRKYPKCQTGISLNNQMCVCDPITEPGKYDCGDILATDATFTTARPAAGKFQCIQQQNGKRECTDKGLTAPAGTISGLKPSIGAIRVGVNPLDPLKLQADVFKDSVADIEAEIINANNGLEVTMESTFPGIEIVGLPTINGKIAQGKIRATEQKGNFITIRLKNQGQVVDTRTITLTVSA